MDTTPERRPDPAAFAAMMTRSYEGRLPADVRQIIADETIVPLPEKPHIVDLGCGPGLWLREVAALRPDATLAGYDRDAPMLDAARGMGVKHARWHSADIGTADFALKPQSADVIAMHFVFHYFADPRHLLATIRTALRPHGALVLTGWFRSSFADFFDFWTTTARQEVGNVQPAGEGPPDPEAFVYQRFAEFGRWSLDDARWLLEHNGFAVRRAAHYSKTFAYLIADTHP